MRAIYLFTFLSLFLVSCGGDSGSDARQYSYTGIIGQDGFGLAMQTDQGQIISLQAANQQVQAQLNQYIGQRVTVYSDRAVVTQQGTFGAPARSTFTVQSVAMGGVGTSGGGQGNSVCGSLTAYADIYGMTYYLNSYIVQAQTTQAQNFLVQVNPGYSYNVCAFYSTPPSGGVLRVTHFQ